MGLAERDYSRRGSSASGLAALREWSATAWIIAILLALFVLEAILTPPMLLQLTQMTREPVADAESAQFETLFMGPIARQAHFSVARVREGQVWRVLTFPLIHADVWPMLIGVACLALFARPLEAELGAGPFMALLALCTLAAPAAYVALYAAGYAIHAPYLPLVGAGGGVLGVVLAAACAGHDDEVVIWGGGVTLPRRALAWIGAALLAVVLLKQDVTGASAAHVGGAIVGLASVPLVRRLVR